MVPLFAEIDWLIVNNLLTALTLLALALTTAVKLWIANRDNKTVVGKVEKGNAQNEEIKMVLGEVREQTNGNLAHLQKELVGLKQILTETLVENAALKQAASPKG